jgi:hypothetical protein
MLFLFSPLFVIKLFIFSHLQHLLFLLNLKGAELQCLRNEDIQNWLNFPIKVKELVILDLS